MNVLTGGVLVLTTAKTATCAVHRLDTGGYRCIDCGALVPRIFERYAA